MVDAPIESTAATVVNNPKSGEPSGLADKEAVQTGVSPQDTKETQNKESAVDPMTPSARICLLITGASLFVACTWATGLFSLMPNFYNDHPIMLAVGTTVAALFAAVVMDCLVPNPWSRISDQIFVGTVIFWTGRTWMNIVDDNILWTIPIPATPLIAGFVVIAALAMSICIAVHRKHTEGPLKTADIFIWHSAWLNVAALGAIFLVCLCINLLSKEPSATEFDLSFYRDCMITHNDPDFCDNARQWAKTVQEGR